MWSAAYINTPILQDSFSNGTIQPDSRIYFLHDANWDTTAVVGYDAASGTWNVVQRYVYSPYGSLTILNADFSTPPSGTVPMTDYLYQGMSLDPVTGLYYERNRNYSPSLGVWTSGEPFRVIGASRWVAGDVDARRRSEAVSGGRHTEGCQRGRCGACGPPFASPRRRELSAYHLVEIRPRSVLLGGSQNSSRREVSNTRTGSLDPLQYINGANTYQFVGSDPVGMVDAEGWASGVLPTGQVIPATAPGSAPGSGKVVVGASTSPVRIAPGVTGSGGATATVTTGGNVTGKATVTVTTNVGNGTTVTAKATAKVTGKIAGNPGMPNLSVGAKCQVNSSLGGLPFDVYIGGKTYNLGSPSALSGATVTAGVSTDNQSGLNVGITATENMAGVGEFFLLLTGN